MKIAFIGSHGVGKTTLSYDVAAQFKRLGTNVDIVKEVARLSPLPINQRTSRDAQLWILMTQIAEEIRSASQHDLVVCDRSVLDNYAYMARACGRQPEIERFLDFWLGTYDLLFKVPIVGAASPDGVRDVDEQFVHAIDDLVDCLLADKGLVHVRLDAADRERWIQRVREAVLRHPASPVPALQRRP